MRNTKNIFAATSLSILLATAVLAQTSSFTYQGKLADAGLPANATYDITFTLFDTIANGSQIGSAVVRNDVLVSDGAFSADLDFGVAAFASGESRFLQIEVRLGSSTGTYTPLFPRQPLTSSPYAVKAASATSADSLSEACILCIRDEKIDTVNAGKITGVLNYFQGGTGLGGPGPFPVAGLFLRSTGTGLGLAGLTASDVPNNSITTPKIVDGSITAPKIAEGAVTVNGLGDGSVINQKIADESVTGNKIKTGAAGTLKWFIATGNDELRANTSVVVEAPSEIRLHLPDSPSPGDFFRVISSDIGGFKITQNGTQSISVGNASIPRIYWTTRDSPRRWRAIASSADGSRLVAAVENIGSPAPGFLYVSTDAGVTWNQRESSRRWSSVASSADGMRLIASVGPTDVPGITGLLYVSNDGGTSWTPRETPRAWISVASSADGTKLAAVVDNGQIYTSADSGETWVPRNAIDDWRSIASSANGLTLIAAGGRRVYKSTDSGESWTVSLDLPSTSGFSALSVASSPDGTKLIAGATGNNGGGPIFISADGGLTWTPRALNGFWRSVATSADGTRLAAVSGSSQIYTSNDAGLTWTPTENARDWRSIAMSNDGEKLFAVADGSHVMVRGRIKSTTGTIGGLTGTSSDSVELVYVGAGKFLIVDLKGTVTLF